MRFAATTRGLLTVAVVACSGCYATMHPLADCPQHGHLLLKDRELGAALDRLCTGQCFSGGHSGMDCGCVVTSPDQAGVDYRLEEDCPVVCKPECDDCRICRRKPIRQAVSRLRNCDWYLGKNVQPGPVPIRHETPLPPTFLPVPARPIFAAVNPHAAHRSSATVELDWDPQLSMPQGY